MHVNRALVTDWFWFRVLVTGRSEESAQSLSSDAAAGPRSFFGGRAWQGVTLALFSGEDDQPGFLTTKKAKSAKRTENQ
jgi:hypothetical protein